MITGTKFFDNSLVARLDAVRAAIFKPLVDCLVIFAESAEVAGKRESNQFFDEKVSGLVDALIIVFPMLEETNACVAKEF